MRNYKVFKVKTNPINVDLVSGALWELDILGINESTELIEISVYEDSEVTNLDLKNILQKLVDEKLLKSFEIREETLENQNWNEEWESKAKIIEIGKRLIVKPSFKEIISNENKIIINIDPKMSFGTGEHQTTQIMMNLCEKYMEFGYEVLDIGSGTGILSLAASKLGARSVLAVDNDEWCYVNALENIANNNVNNIKVIQGTIENIEKRDYDLVMANINKNVILEIAENLTKVLKQNGILLISGILLNDMEVLERQFTRAGLTAEKTEIIDGWLGIVFRKN